MSTSGTATIDTINNSLRTIKTACPNPNPVHGFMFWHCVNDDDVPLRTRDNNGIECDREDGSCILLPHFFTTFKAVFREVEEGYQCLDLGVDIGVVLKVVLNDDDDDPPIPVCGLWSVVCGLSILQSPRRVDTGILNPTIRWWTTTCREICNLWCLMRARWIPQRQVHGFENITVGCTTRRVLARSGLVGSRPPDMNETAEHMASSHCCLQRLHQSLIRL